jgi:hypothetical protein
MRPITEPWREFIAALDISCDPESRMETFLQLRQTTPVEDGIGPAFLFAQKRPEEFAILVEKAIPGSFLELSKDVRTIKGGDDVSQPRRMARDVPHILRVAMDKRLTRDVAVHFLIPLAWSLYGPSVIDPNARTYVDTDCWPVLEEVFARSAQPI